MTSKILIYNNEQGNVKGNLRLEEETVWLNPAQLVQLFQKSKAYITEHIKYVIEEGELVENSVFRKFRVNASYDKSYDTNYYNLDVIISVGCI